MKTVKISVQEREKLGKKETKSLRKEDMVPCVLYGGKENFHFYAHENLFKKVVYTPNVYIIELASKAGTHKAIMQEIQFHPVTDKLLHIDFVEVFDDRPVVVNIPIELTGISIGVKEGGKLRQKRRYLKVKGLPNDLPDSLIVDISKVNIGEVIKIGDLDYKNLEILDPQRSMVVSVVSARVAMKSMIVEEVEVEGAEGDEEAEGTEGAESNEDEGKKASE